MTKLPPPKFADVLTARRVISPHILRTPVRRYPGLCDLVGADVWVKHENYQVMGSFKPRGGLNLIGSSSLEERERGFITASSGNHGQSICFAARTFGSKAVVVVPENANPVKVSAMEAIGAKVIKHGAYFDRSNEHAMALAEETGMRYVHAVNEPPLYAGVGTYTLEIFEDLSDVDYIIVPVGGGSGASGVCIVTQTVSPSTKVIGVQAAAAPAAHDSWKSGNLETRKMETAAEGLATGSAYQLAVDTLRAGLHDFKLVSEDEILNGIELFVRHTRSVVEHASATTIAAALNMKEELQGKRVVLVASGANVTAEQLIAALSRG